MCPALRIAAFLSVVALAAAAEAGERAGEIAFSDGTVLAGRICTSPGHPLRVHSGARVREIALDQVAEIRFHPVREEMHQAWRFVTAGQTRKQRSGAPYPVRHLEAQVVLADGTVVQGHLFTTVLYVDDGQDVDKVIVKAKQRGDPDTALADLTYPTHVRFAQAPAEAASGEVRVRLVGPHADAAPELAALGLPDLVRLPARADAAPGTYRMPAPLGARLVFAARTEEALLVGWPENGTEDLRARVEAAVGMAKDFFDTRRVLGVHVGEEGEAVYALVLLHRTEQVTLRAEKNHPWRLGAWRFQADPQADKLLLAGRGVWFRGLVAAHAAPPRVRIAPALARVAQEGDGLVVGGEE